MTLALLLLSQIIAESQKAHAQTHKFSMLRLSPGTVGRLSSSLASVRTSDISCALEEPSFFLNDYFYLYTSLSLRGTLVP